jgi:alkylation response protein AidB-like acyl-CoA dehydrogenase
MKTRAVREGDDYIVNGQKIWSTRAHVADFCELLVRTDPEAPKHKGITWLILDMHQPGVEVRPMRTIDGESHFCEVFFTDARVPVTNRVGAENDGWRVANVTLRFERGTAFAQHIITMRTHIRKLVLLARQVPSAKGRVAWDDPSLRAQVGRLEAAVDGLWRLTQRGITEAERTGIPAPTGSAVKLRYSELTQEITELVMRVAGEAAIGGAKLGDISAEAIVHDYLWSLQYTIAAGTSQIQRNLVAERILGMPRR